MKMLYVAVKDETKMIFDKLQQRLFQIDNKRVNQNETFEFAMGIINKWLSQGEGKE